MTEDPCAMAIVGDAQVIEFVGPAMQRLIVIAPAVTKEVATAIVEAAVRLPHGQTTVILDTDPEVYRLGYGDPKSLEMLEQGAASGQSVLRRQPGLRLCIVIADSQTLIYAPTPKLIEAGPNTFGGANAIYLGPPPVALERELDPDEGRPRIGAEPFTSKDGDVVRRDLDDNPPQAFDIARRMRVFNAYYEFVELELTGIHIDRKQVRIPEHLLGVADERTRARLRSHFRLIPEDSELSGEPLRNDRDLIARKFLTTVPRFGSVVRRTDKTAMEDEVSALRARIETFKETLKQQLQASMDHAREELVEALLPGVSANPPKKWCASDGRKPDGETCRRFLEQDLVHAFGKASRLLSGMEIILRFKGLTYETLNDKKFIEAATRAGLDVARLHEEFNAAKGQPSPRAQSPSGQ
jgi:hypothetical protein